MKNKWIKRGIGATLIAFSLLAMKLGPSKSVVLPFDGSFFTTDNLGNLFLVGSDNSIEKYDLDGNKLSEANFKIYGNLSQLDASNPFEIYAYYYDQQTLLILDNMLSLRAEISMSDISTSEVSAAARSFDNGIWYFDASSMKLLKTGKNLETEIEGVPMGTWTQENWAPQQIIDNEKNIFVHDSAQGFCIFDVFGNYYRTLEVEGLSDFQIKKNKVVYFKDNYLSQYDFKLFTTDTLLVDSLSKQVRFEANGVFRWKNDSLYIEKK